jgi:hypothetical protein
MFNRKRPLVGAFIIPLVLGLVGFFRVTQSPQFESYRNFDVVQLVVSGACFGAAIVLLMVSICRPRN